MAERVKNRGCGSTTDCYALAAAGIKQANHDCHVPLLTPPPPRLKHVDAPQDSHRTLNNTLAQLQHLPRGNTKESSLQTAHNAAVLTRQAPAPLKLEH